MGVHNLKFTIDHIVMKIMEESPEILKAIKIKKKTYSVEKIPISSLIHKL